MFRLDLTSVEGAAEEEEAEEDQEQEEPAHEEALPSDESEGRPLPAGVADGVAGAVEAAFEAAEAVEEAAVETLPPTEEGDVAADLSHPSVEVRIAALSRLRGEPEAAPLFAVSACLQDPEPRVREEAVAVLRTWPDEHGLLLLVDSLQDPSETVRQAAKDALVARRAPALVRLLEQELRILARCKSVAVLLMEMGEEDALLRAFSGADAEVRGLVRDILEDRGITERLAEDLTDTRPDRRREAADALGAIGTRRRLDDLVERLGDPDRRVRISAIEALGRIGDPSVTQDLKRALVEDPDMAVVAAVGQALRAIASGGI